MTGTFWAFVAGIAIGVFFVADYFVGVQEDPQIVEESGREIYHNLIDTVKIWLK